MVAVCDNNHLKVLTQQKGVKTLQHASIPAFKRVLLSFSNKLSWHTPPSSDSPKSSDGLFLISNDCTLCERARPHHGAVTVSSILILFHFDSVGGRSII